MHFLHQSLKIKYSNSYFFLDLLLNNGSIAAFADISVSESELHSLMSKSKRTPSVFPLFSLLRTVSPLVEKNIGLGFKNKNCEY